MSRLDRWMSVMTNNQWKTLTTPDHQGASLKPALLALTGQCS